MDAKLAQQLIEQASELKEQGKADEAIDLYDRVIAAYPDWSVPYYNLGLLYKYQYDWEQSYQYNKKAVELDPDDEAAWWNLGIAATVLNDWIIARQAWNQFGLNLEISNEEVNLNMAKAPIRLNPDSEAEVVWCTRIDPARAVILNVPLASSNHRYGDLILNDGAAVGKRISEGVEYPVFNELQLLTRSAYSTYSITVHTNDQSDFDKLDELCGTANLKLEDWSTIRMLCKQCSEGIPHEHHDQELEQSETSERYIGFAALTESSILEVLSDWRAITLCEHTELRLELA